MRLIARTMSVDLSMTMTAAVPRPDPSAFSPSKSIGASMISAAGTEAPTIRRDDGEEVVPPAANAAAMLVDQLAEADPIASSTTQGVFTWPDSWNSLVPSFFSRPMPANQAAPRRRIVGTTAMLSTLLTVVGQP